MNTPDLTRRPPRSARVKLGGYVILPRILDVGRPISPVRQVNTNTAPNRDDLSTWFDLLDLDDYASFGGQA
jgi:hypothetical protein